MKSIADRVSRRTVRAHGLIPVARSSWTLVCFLCSVPRPPFTHLHRSWDAQRILPARFRDHVLRAVERPPRGVTVFAERRDQIGAAGPQKRRRHFTPSRACRFVRRISLASTTPAPSRRLQRVSVEYTPVPRGQASRRRPPSAARARPPTAAAMGARSCSARPVHRPARSQLRATRRRFPRLPAPAGPTPPETRLTASQNPRTSMTGRKTSTCVTPK